MVRVLFAGLVAILLAVSSSGRCSVRPLSPGEAKQWVRYLCPLPKSINITGQMEIRKGAASVVLKADNDLLCMMAAKELRDVLGAGDIWNRDGFNIILQIGGAESDPLKSLRNSAQAYRIITSPEKREMRLVALAPAGLYYASKTLQQLVAARSTSEKVVVPVVEITDWPDLEKRGFWGADNFMHLKWLGDLKFNLCEQISAVGVDDEKQAFARVKPGREPLIWEGPLYGIEFSPVILHLEQSSQAGVLKAYPQFKGKSEHPGVMCYSQPGIADVIADWMVQLAKIPGVSTLDCWLTENLGGKTGCQCEKCRDKKWQVLELQTVLSAWEKAKAKLGRHFDIMITTSEAIEPELPSVLEALPGNVRLSYYHSLRTYNDRNLPIIPEPVSELARKGHWVGVVPNLDSLTGFWQPFHGAAFVRYRMSEFVDKQLSGLIGYVTPRMHYYKFNVEAAAEWSWNARGRSTREFAVSYAVRHGIKDAEKFADWSETLGPVAWRCYGSAWPAGEGKKQPPTVARRLRDGSLPEVGQSFSEFYPSPWGDFPSEAQLDADAKATARALKLAKELGREELIQETLVIDGYIRSLKALAGLKKLVRPGGKIASRDMEQASKYFREYIAALRQSQTALPKWESTVKAPQEEGRFCKRVVDIIETAINQMTELVRDAGVKLN